MPCECSECGDRVRINLGYETADLLRTGYDTTATALAWCGRGKTRRSRYASEPPNVALQLPGGFPS